MRVRSIVWSISSAMVFSVGLTMAQGETTTWDACGGFEWYSQGTNWTYGEVTPGSNAGYVPATQMNTVDTGAGIDSNIAWTEGTYRYVGKSTPNTELRANPGDTTAAYVGWISRSNQTVNATFSLTDRNDLSGAGAPDFFDGVEYWLYKSGGATPLAHALVAEGGSSGTVNVSGIGVSTGDSLYLQIGPGINHHSAGDLTGISFTVAQAIPEPATLTMVATAMLGLLAYAWRKRR